MASKSPAFRGTIDLDMVGENDVNRYRHLGMPPLSSGETSSDSCSPYVTSYGGKHRPGRKSFVLSPLSKLKGGNHMNNKHELDAAKFNNEREYPIGTNLFQFSPMRNGKVFFDERDQRSHNHGMQMNNVLYKEEPKMENRPLMHHPPLQMALDPVFHAPDQHTWNSEKLVHCIFCHHKLRFFEQKERVCDPCKKLHAASPRSGILFAPESPGITHAMDIHLADFHLDIMDPLASPPHVTLSAPRLPKTIHDANGSSNLFAENNVKPNVKQLHPTKKWGENAVKLEVPPPLQKKARRSSIRSSITRKCEVPGCERGVRSRGLCKGHGGGRRCRHPGCGLSDQGGGFCIQHGGGKRCSVEGCPNSCQSRGLCKKHGGGTRCQVQGCTKSSQGGGRCRMHGGGNRCSVEGCNKTDRRSGLCVYHGADRTCIAHGCMKTARSDGYCATHFAGQRHLRQIEKQN